MLPPRRIRHQHHSHGAGARHPQAPERAPNSTPPAPPPPLPPLPPLQEPLPASFLQQLGLGRAVPVLPGAPVCFFEADHHMFTVGGSGGVGWAGG